MVFIFGSNFPERLLVTKALQGFYGIGEYTAARIMARHYINPRAICRQLQQRTILALNTELQGMKIENDLRREVRDNIGRLRDMKTYRGLRHALGLPVRGQRTRTQIKTAQKLNKVERRG